MRLGLTIVASLVTVLAAAQTGVIELVGHEEGGCLGDCPDDADDGECPPDCEMCVCSPAPRTALAAVRRCLLNVEHARPILEDPTKAPPTGVVDRIFRPPRPLTSV